MENLIKVGMADMQSTKFPYGLTTLGLGSCVGIALFDPVKKIAGLAHIMLPSSQQVTNNSNIAKFADTGIEKLLDDMIKLGASKSSIKAKLAGGAQMFSFGDTSDVMRIGARNVASSKEKLRELGIPVIAEDTGGSYGRTIVLDSGTGKLLVKTIGHGIKEI